jgi:hypothetical protein
MKELFALFDRNNIQVSDSCEHEHDAVHSFRFKSTLALPDCHPIDLKVILESMGYKVEKVVSVRADVYNEVSKAIEGGTAKHSDWTKLSKFINFRWM